MDWTPITCPRCRAARLMRGTHVCRCGQRFKVPRAGRFNVLPDEDRATLFYLPGTAGLVGFDLVCSALEARGIGSDDGMLAMPVAWIESAEP